MLDGRRENVKRVKEVKMGNTNHSKRIRLHGE